VPRIRDVQGFEDVAVCDWLSVDSMHMIGSYAYTMSAFIIVEKATTVFFF
jgi:hypothetical protein